MIKKNKKGFLKATCLMLASMMLAFSVMSVTMAKYKSEGNVNLSSIGLNVAKWEIDIDETPISGETIELTSIDWKIYNINESESSLPENTIAPGTWGYGTIEIKNAGDVDAIVYIYDGDITLTASSNISSGMSIMFIISETQPNYTDFVEGYNISSSDGTSTITIANIESNFILAAHDNTNIYICYEWKFDGNDDYDTNLAGTTFTFSGSLTIEAVQAMPKN